MMMMLNIDWLATGMDPGLDGYLSLPSASIASATYIFNDLLDLRGGPAASIQAATAHSLPGRLKLTNAIKGMVAMALGGLA